MIIAYNQYRDEKIILGEDWGDVVMVGEAGHRIRQAIANNGWESCAVFDDTDNKIGKDAKVIEPEGEIALFYYCDRDYVQADDGAFFEYTVDGEIRRFDTMIMALAVGLPDELAEPYYFYLGGWWADKCIYALPYEPAGKNVTYDYDLESFHLPLSDMEIRYLVRDVDMAESLWAADIIGFLDEE